MGWRGADIFVAEDRTFEWGSLPVVEEGIPVVNIGGGVQNPTSARTPRTPRSADPIDKQAFADTRSMLRMWLVWKQRLDEKLLKSPFRPGLAILKLVSNLSMLLYVGLREEHVTCLIAGTQSNFTRNAVAQTPPQTNSHVSGKKVPPIVVVRDAINWAVSCGPALC
jgi:hypothetical protein